MIGELWKSHMGKAGIVLFLVLSALSVYVFSTFPRDFGTAVWNNPKYWTDNPKSAPPSWVSLFGNDAAEHQVLRGLESRAAREESAKTLVWEFPVKRKTLPAFVSFSVSGVEFRETSPILELYLEKDGESFFLWRHIVPGRKVGEATPTVRYQESPFRALLSSDPEFRTEFERLFNARTDNHNLNLIVTAYLGDSRDHVGQIKMVLGGESYGMLGTDHLGRDIFQGILFGLPIALFIALTTSLAATLLGTIYGSVSGYMGGKTDTLMQWFIDVLVSVPLLPILIFLVFVLGPNILYVVLILMAFGWTSLALRLRPWIFQIRASGFVEFSRAKGFSAPRIIFLHVIPQTIPFLFASFIFFAPAAILAEAGLSFIGLGDPSLPTWGQMLNQSFATGAHALGYWWQILSPGIAIVVTALSFFLIAFAMEPIVEPRLRKD